MRLPRGAVSIHLGVGAAKSEADRFGAISRSVRVLVCSMVRSLSSVISLTR